MNKFTIANRAGGKHSLLIRLKGCKLQKLFIVMFSSIIFIIINPLIVIIIIQW